MQSVKEASRGMEGLQACLFPAQCEHNPWCLPHFSQGAVLATLRREVCDGHAWGGVTGAEGPVPSLLI